MPVFVDNKGNKYETAQDTTPEELKEPLSMIISLKSVIAWSKKANEFRTITKHMQTSIIEMQRKLDEITTWNEYLNEYLEIFKKLVPEAILSYDKAPDIPEEKASEVENVEIQAQNESK